MKHSYETLREMVELGHNDLHKVQIKTSKGVVLRPNKWQGQTYTKSMCTEVPRSSQSHAHWGVKSSQIYPAAGFLVDRLAQERVKRGSR